MPGVSQLYIPNTVVNFGKSLHVLFLVFVQLAYECVSHPAELP